MRTMLLALLVVLGTYTSAFGQITSYELRYYAVGAANPTQTQTIPSNAVACNQAAAPTTASTTNPTDAEWNDPSAPGRVCRVVLASVGGNVIPSLPVGNYEGVVVALNDAGRSPESNRAPFARLDAPGSRSGLRLVRP